MKICDENFLQYYWFFSESGYKPDTIYPRLSLGALREAGEWKLDHVARLISAETF